AETCLLIFDFLVFHYDRAALEYCADPGCDCGTSALPFVGRCGLLISVAASNCRRALWSCEKTVERLGQVYSPPHEEGTTQARQGAASIEARSQENRPRLQLLGSEVVAVLLILTVARNYVWADEFRLFSDVVTKSPHKLRAYENLIFAHMKRGQEDQAIRVASLAIQNVTIIEQLSLLDTIGNLYLRMQRPPDAIEYFKQSNYVALRFPSPGAYFLATSFNNLGAAYLALAKTYDTRQAGERAQALHHAREAFEKSLQQESSVAVLGSLVNVSQQLGEASIFEAQLRKNLAGNPNEFNSLYMLAELLSLEDRYQESLEYFRRAEEQNKQSEVLGFN